MRNMIYVGFDQLHKDYGALAKADPKKDLIVFVESERMISGRKWHKQRLWFLLASVKNFQADLREKGFEVIHLKAPNTLAGLVTLKDKYNISTIQAATPNSYRLKDSLSKLVQYSENDFFLTTEAEFQSWASSQKKMLMENFYRNQRIKFNILMEGNQPAGGKWNYDHENRGFPDEDYEFPKYLKHQPNEIDLEVWNEIENSGLDLWGEDLDGTWGTTRKSAKKQLDHFLKYNLSNFGPFEDAMLTDNWSLHHSLLSPYLNNGLLHPLEVVAAVSKKYQSGEIPIQSAEGFIRQVIGWREYVRGAYWYLGEGYRNENQLHYQKKLLPLFHHPEKTNMNCLSTIVKDISKRSWVHHIPRLMVLSNLALLTGINPQVFLNWMREVFIDAADWVMVPNVIGMGMHADGGKMMTKPYIAGGSYISKMSNYCGDCKYNPKLRVGENACPFTSLYWNFLAENKDKFSKNPRMFQQFSGMKKLSDLAETQDRAKEVIQGLVKGTI